MRTEIELPTGTVTINNSSGKGSSIEIDGFKATIRELQTLEMLHRGLSRAEISIEQNISQVAVGKNVSNLLVRNADDFSEGIPGPDIAQLTDTAIHHEILNRISILGIEYAVSRARAQSKEENAKLVKSDYSIIKPTKDIFILNTTYPVTTHLMEFANQNLDKFVERNAHRGEQVQKIKEYVFMLIQGREVSKSEIIQNGFNFREIFIKAHEILINYGHEVAKLKKRSRKNF